MAQAARLALAGNPSVRQHRSMAMSRTLLAALALAVIGASAMVCESASATMIVSASLQNAATPHGLPVHRIRNVCGLSGCAPVLVKRVRVPPRNLNTTAAPLVVSNSPAPAAASSALPSLPSLPSLLPSLPSLSSLPSPLSLLQGK